MFYVFMIAAPLIFVFLFIAIATRHCPAVCPECQYPMSRFQSPFTKTMHQWKYGGFLCARCGCELDIEGKVIARTEIAVKPPTWVVSLLLVVPLFLVLLVPVTVYFLTKQP